MRPDRDELAKALQIAHEAPIRESNEWRPLAGHVLTLVNLARVECRKQTDRLLNYVHHEAACESMFGFPGGELPKCTCGLATVLRKLG